LPLLLHRHAKAGHRRQWQGDDRLRPLDEYGRRQAAALPGQLARFEIKHIASSPYVRCTDSVKPLSQQRGVPIEERHELEEGASHEETLALLRELGDDALLCTHGDILEELLGEEGKKGSTRVVELRDGKPLVVESLAPPA
jgi:broad specificity phosphatase PhoE